VEEPHPLLLVEIISGVSEEIGPTLCLATWVYLKPRQSFCEEELSFLAFLGMIEQRMESAFCESVIVSEITTHIAFCPWLRC